MTPQRPSAGRHLPAALRLVPMATRYFAGATQAAGGAAGSACRLGGAPPPFLYACARSRPRKCSRGALTRRRAGAGVGGRGPRCDCGERVGLGAGAGLLE